MTWLLFGVLALLAIGGIGIMLAPGRRAPSRLNNQGLPRPTTRADHRQNDEE
ncbi:MAG TPA: hypothetical protein VGK74_01345 [Symbiobacteriaceae bacterium]